MSSSGRNDLGALVLAAGDARDAADAANAAAAAASSAITPAVAHGVLWDGVTDDSPALQALVDSLSAAGGGHIGLPVGYGKLGAAINPKDNVTISGAGHDVTIVKPVREAFQAGTRSTAAPLTEFHLRGLTIDGANQVAAGTYKGIGGQYHLRCTWQELHVMNTQMTGVGVDFLRGCLIKNVITENTGLANDGTMPSGNGIGIGQGGWADTEDFLVTGCKAINAKRYGIMLEGGTTTTGGRFIGNYATACGNAGFGIGGGTGSIWLGNEAYANVGHGFTIGTLTVSSSLAPTQAIVNNNIARANGGHGFFYDATQHRPQGGYTQICENISEENTGRGLLVSIDLSLLTSQGQITGLKVDNNLFYKNGSAAYEITAINAGAFLPTGWRFNGNLVAENCNTAGETHQVRVGVSMTGCDFTQNMFYHHSTSASVVGIYIGHGGTAVTMAACRISGNTSANTGNNVLAVDAAATLDTACVVTGNLPDAGSPFPKTVIANYTLNAGDTLVLANIGGGAGVGRVYLPPAASAGSGRVYTVKNINADSMQVRVNDATNIDGAISDSLNQWSAGVYESNGATWYKVGGKV